MPFATSNSVHSTRRASYVPRLEIIPEGDETSGDELGLILPARPPEPKQLHNQRYMNSLSNQHFFSRYDQQPPFGPGPSDDGPGFTDLITNMMAYGLAGAATARATSHYTGMRNRPSATCGFVIGAGYALINHLTQK